MATLSLPIDRLAQRTEVAAELPRELPSLTAMRAVAAFAVFTYHLYQWKVFPYSGLRFGYIGVGFFFVLSGFILTWTYRPGPRSVFYRRRFARVWPLHAVTLLVTLLVPITNQPLSWKAAVVNVPLLQAWFYQSDVVFGMNAVSWSLSCEFAFYALFPLLLWWAQRQPLRRVVAVVLLAYLGASLIVLTSAVVVPHAVRFGTMAYANPLVRLPEFGLGIVAALAVRRGWAPRWPLVAVCVAFTAAGLAFTTVWPTANVWAVPLFVLVIATLARQGGTRPAVLRARWLIYAGEISFAFYLVHELALMNTRALLGPGVATALVAFTLSVVGAVVLHHAVEIPAQRFLSGSRPKRVAPAAVDGPAQG